MSTKPYVRPAELVCLRITQSAAPTEPEGMPKVLSEEYLNITPLGIYSNGIPFPNVLPIEGADCVEIRAYFRKR